MNVLTKIAISGVPPLGTFQIENFLILYLEQICARERAFKQGQIQQVGAFKGLKSKIYIFSYMNPLYWIKGCQIGFEIKFKLARK